MKHRQHRTVLWVALLLWAGCQAESSSLGASCPAESYANGGPGVSIDSPVLECASRTCLRVDDETTPGTSVPALAPPRGTCTDLCDTDDDCAGGESDACPGGYVCAVPAVTGAFCCLEMCVCRGDLDSLPGAQPTPGECLVADPQNDCPNLPGRGTTRATSSR